MNRRFAVMETSMNQFISKMDLMMSSKTRLEQMLESMMRNNLPTQNTQAPSVQIAKAPLAAQVVPTESQHVHVGSLYSPTYPLYIPPSPQHANQTYGNTCPALPDLGMNHYAQPEYGQGVAPQALGSYDLQAPYHRPPPHPPPSHQHNGYYHRGEFGNYDQFGGLEFTSAAAFGAPSYGSAENYGSVGSCGQWGNHGTVRNYGQIGYYGSTPSYNQFGYNGSVGYYDPVRRNAHFGGLGSTSTSTFRAPCSLSFGTSADRKSMRSDNKSDELVGPSLSHNDSSKTSLYIQAAARPLVSPSFASTSLEKNLSIPTSVISQNMEVGNALVDDDRSLDYIDNDQDGKLLDPQSSSNVLEQALNSGKMSGILTSIQEATHFWKDDIANDHGNQNDALSDITNTASQDHSTTILEKLINNALSKDTDNSPNSIEHQEGRVEEGTWSPASLESPKFANWFSEDKRKPIEDFSSGIHTSVVANVEHGEKLQRIKIVSKCDRYCKEALVLASQKFPLQPVAARLNFGEGPHQVSILQEEARLVWDPGELRALKITLKQGFHYQEVLRCDKYLHSILEKKPQELAQTMKFKILQKLLEPSLYEELGLLHDTLQGKVQVASIFPSAENSNEEAEALLGRLFHEFLMFGETEGVFESLKVKGAQASATCLLGLQVPLKPFEELIDSHVGNLMPFDPGIKCIQGGSVSACSSRSEVCELLWKSKDGVLPWYPIGIGS